jgi:two-component system response regulator
MATHDRWRDPAILLVEDDQNHAALMLRALRRNNIANEVVVARDGAEALDYLLGTGATGEQAPAELPGVIILDLKLPKVDGLEVLRRLRDDERTRLVPVVVLSSSDEEKDIAASYRLGANSYVRKPVDFTRFLESTRQMGAYWLLLNVAPPPPRR